MIGAALLFSQALSLLDAPSWSLDSGVTEKDGRFVVTTDATTRAWGTVATTPLHGEIAAGDTVTVHARLRSASRMRVGLAVEGTQPEAWVLAGSRRLSAGWQEVRYAGVAIRPFPSGSAHLSLWLGYGPGAFEIRDVRVENLGEKPLAELDLTQDPYGGEPNPDDWRKAAERRIEKIRKGDLTVQVLDATGKPVRGASVHVHQLRHAFQFGTAAPASLLAREDETGERFRATLARLFNTVTFENDLKWSPLDDVRKPDVEKAFAWFAKEGIVARGHNLVWGSRQWAPRGLWEKSDEGIREAIKARIARAVARYKGRVYLWDVVNEAVSEHELWDRIGWEWFDESFRLAHAADPAVRLAYNDFDLTEESSSGPGHLTRAKALIQRLIDAKAPFDTIGIQSHVLTPITPTKRVLGILDELARYGKRLEITEYDLSLLDDEAHGRHMADYLTACFSHPAVDAFIVWGFWEGSHWRAAQGGAMFRRDWTPRPAALAYEDLVKRRWWTDATLRSDAKGKVRLRAFYGTHRIAVGGTTADFSLAKGGPAATTIRLLETAHVR